MKEGFREKVDPLAVPAQKSGPWISTHHRHPLNRSPPPLNNLLPPTMEWRGIPWDRQLLRNHGDCLLPLRSPTPPTSSCLPLAKRKDSTTHSRGAGSDYRRTLKWVVRSLVILYLVIVFLCIVYCYCLPCYYIPMYCLLLLSTLLLYSYVLFTVIVYLVIIFLCIVYCYM